MIGPCSLEMKYLFASDCYFEKVAGQRDLEERVRLTVSSSTSFFDCKNVTRFGVPLAPSSTH